MITERVLQSTSSMWLSEGGTWLAYLKLNDSLLSSVSLPSLDPDRQEDLRYPKVCKAVIIRVFKIDLSMEGEVLPLCRYWGEGG